MGNTYTVEKWVPANEARTTYEYVGVYRGESFFKALYAMWQAKHDGSRCVQLSWRS